MFQPHFQITLNYTPPDKLNGCRAFSLLWIFNRIRADLYVTDMDTSTVWLEKSLCLLNTSLSSHADTAHISLSSLKACGLFYYFFPTLSEPELQQFLGDHVCLRKKQPFQGLSRWGVGHRSPPPSSKALIVARLFLSDKLLCFRAEGILGKEKCACDLAII